MKQAIIGAALAAAVSLGAAGDAGAQSVGDRVREARRVQTQQDARDRRDNDRRDDDRRVWDQRDRYDSRINTVRLGEYLRGISLNRGQRQRVERAWEGRGSREQRLRAVRSYLSRSQQRRFDANVSQIERRYDRRDNDRWGR